MEDVAPTTSVESAAPVAAVESTPDTGAGAEGGGRTVSAPITTASAPTGAPAVTAADDAWPSVDWNSWDGEVKTLPTNYHESAQGMSDYYSRSYEEKNNEISDLRSMYAAMLSGDEDPRVGELTTELKDLNGRFDERNKEYDELQQTYTKTEERAVSDYVDQFWREHSDLRKDQEKLARFSPFLREENDVGGMWDGHIAAQLVDLSEEALAAAVEAKKDGVSDQYALKLGLAHARLEEMNSQPVGPSAEEIASIQTKAIADAEAKAAKAPRQGAKITNGAIRASRPRMAKKGMGEAKSLDEMRILASRRAFSVHGGGRK